MNVNITVRDLNYGYKRNMLRKKVEQRGENDQDSTHWEITY